MGHVAGAQGQQKADAGVRLGLRVTQGGGGPAVESGGPALLPCVCSSRQAHPPLCFSLAKKLTFNLARRFLGLHRCRHYFNLGMGLPGATLEYFLSLNMPIRELYGLAESTGIHTLSSQGDFRLLRWVWGGRGGADLQRLLLDQAGARCHPAPILPRPLGTADPKANE